MKKWFFPRFISILSGVFFFFMSLADLFVFSILFEIIVFDHLGIITNLILLVGNIVLFLFLFFLLFIMKECFTAVRISEAGILFGVGKRNKILWDEVTEIGVAPHSCGNFRKRMYLKNKAEDTIYVVCGGNTDSLAEFGVVYIAMQHYFKVFGKIGVWAAKEYIGSWMEKSAPIVELPDKMLYFKYDKKLYEEIEKHLGEHVIKKRIYERI